MFLGRNKDKGKEKKKFLSGRGRGDASRPNPDHEPISVTENLPVPASVPSNGGEGITLSIKLPSIKSPRLKLSQFSIFGRKSSPGSSIAPMSAVENNGREHQDVEDIADQEDVANEDHISDQTTEVDILDRVVAKQGSQYSESPLHEPSLKRNPPTEGDQQTFGDHALPPDAIERLTLAEQERDEALFSIPTDAILLTKPGGLLSISDDVRQYMAIFSDGSCFVHRERLDDDRIREARQKARHSLQNGVRLKDSVAVELSALKQIYETSALNSNKEGVDHTQIRKDFQAVLWKAKELGASDIHIKCRSDRCQVVCEVNGFLTATIQEFPPEMAASLLTTAFYYADQGDHIERPAVPQYQSVTDPKKLPKGTVGLRFTFTPMAGMHRDLNIRLLNSHSDFAAGGLKTLDFLDSQMENLRYIQGIGQRLFSISGETGSGKSTTADLYCEDTSEQKNHAIKINSVDDPVENMMPHIDYIEVRTGTSDSAGDALRAASKVALRNAPHIVKLGECRYKEQAEVAFEASITGKVIITTLHTPSVLDIPARYKSMGIPASEAFDPNRHLAFLGQSLVPGLCLNCCEPLHSSQKDIHVPIKRRIRELFPDLYEEIKVRGEGCSSCSREHALITGITGRFLCAEIIAEPSHKFLSTLQKSWEKGREYWVGEMGGVTKHLHAFQYLRQGFIGADEFLEKVGSFEQLHTDIQWREGKYDVS